MATLLKAIMAAKNTTTFSSFKRFVSKGQPSRLFSRGFSSTTCMLSRRSAQSLPNSRILESHLHKHHYNVPFLNSIRNRHTLVSVAAAAEPEIKTEEESFTYQAEVDRLLDMIVNSLYSNREVFLRELVSNASDALDKVRFVGLTRPEIMSPEPNLEIRIKGDPDTHTIIIEDTGIGMTREELLDQLGTIARSGTKKFMEAVKESKGDANLIGQFGVGFYSSFLVSDKVEVATKSFDDDKTWIWSSNAGSHNFTIREDVNSTLKRGTRITLFLKEDCYELADSFKLKNLLKQYSEFISFPIQLFTSKREPKQIVDEEETKKDQEAENERAKKEEREAKQLEPIMKTEYEEVWDWQVQNENLPIWVRPSKEVTKEQYENFYKQTFGEFLEPLAYTHFNVEGTIEFSSILFIPGMAPLEQDMMKKQKNIRLFVKRVFISDDFDDSLLPRYLAFVKGIVDSSDLPLNVSREILQENRIVRVIKKQLVRRTLDMIDDLAKKENKSDFNKFWESFGAFLKYGVVEDMSNRERLASIIQFPSSKSGDELTGLDGYVSRMKEGQKSIYYMASVSKQAAEAAPFLEGLLKRDYEVLYLTEPVDEVAFANLQKYKDFDCVDISKENLDLGDDESKNLEEVAEKYAVLCEFMKETLGEKIEKVNVSNRLTDSPCIVATSKFGWSANMERIMKNQTMADNKAIEYMKGRKIIEINPDHPLVQDLKKEIDNNKLSRRARVITELLYETALLTSGFTIESPKAYAQKVYSMMTRAVDKSSAKRKDEKKASVKIEEPKVEEPKVESFTPEVVSDADDPWKKE